LRYFVDFVWVVIPHHKHPSFVRTFYVHNSTVRRRTTGASAVVRSEHDAIVQSPLTA
jgi:hypothetical protein